MSTERDIGYSPALTTQPVQDWIIILKQEIVARFHLDPEDEEQLRGVTDPGELLGILREHGLRQQRPDIYVNGAQRSVQHIPYVLSEPRKSPRKPRKSKRLKTA